MLKDVWSFQMLIPFNSKTVSVVSFLDWSVADSISGSSTTDCLVLFSIDNGIIGEKHQYRNGYICIIAFFLQYLRTKLLNQIFSLSYFFTVPPIPDNFESLVRVSEKVYNKFSLKIDSSLLNNTSGPITHVGVLMTSNLSGGFLFLF